MPSIVSVFPETVLLISSTVHNSKEVNKYLQLAKKGGFNKNVQFLGRLDYRLLPAYYSIANVVVQPSIEQNMSLPVKEAMACETPVITLNEGWEQTPNGKAGFLVNTKKPVEITNAITKILADKRMALRMGREGRKIVLNKFTWDSVANMFERAGDHSF